MSVFAVLDGRLSAAAEYVRQGARFADIGTDHARLPLFLLKTGKIEKAIASDVAKGPLSHAEQAVLDAGLTSESVKLVLTDGLNGLENEQLTDIAICGMGGDLTARILSGAEFVKNPDIHLILQPMSHAERVRTYLGETGFRILSETYCRASGRAYVCMLAVFDGVVYTPSALEAEIGKKDIRRESDPSAFKEYLSGRIADRSKELAGLRMAGENDKADHLEKLLSEMKDCLCN